MISYEDTHATLIKEHFLLFIYLFIHTVNVVQVFLVNSITVLFLFSFFFNSKNRITLGLMTFCSKKKLQKFDFDHHANICTMTSLATESILRCFFSFQISSYYTTRSNFTNKSWKVYKQKENIKTNLKWFEGILFDFYCMLSLSGSSLFISFTTPFFSNCPKDMNLLCNKVVLLQQFQREIAFDWWWKICILKEETVRNSK